MLDALDRDLSELTEENHGNGTFKQCTLRYIKVQTTDVGSDGINPNITFSQTQHFG